MLSPINFHLFLRLRPLRGRIVLCLHDELLVHVPAEHADETAAVVDRALGDAARRWLDDHGAEAEWGQDRAWEFAKEHGCPYSRALVREAQQRRKADAQAALNDALEAFEGESE